MYELRYQYRFSVLKHIHESVKSHTPLYMKKHDTHVHEPYGELYIAEDGLIAKVSES